MQAFPSWWSASAWKFLEAYSQSLLPPLSLATSPAEVAAMRVLG